MGREGVDLHAYATVSKHNSPQDDVDAEQWNMFVRDVREAAAKYSLYIDVMAGELTIQGWQA